VPRPSQAERAHVPVLSPVALPVPVRCPSAPLPPFTRPNDSQNFGADNRWYTKDEILAKLADIQGDGYDDLYCTPIQRRPM
jgi:hypothetical protein